MRRPPPFVLVVAGSVLLVALAIAAGIVHREMSPEAKLEPLREELLATRSAVDSCRAALRAEERRFDRFEERVDSLRGRVESYEGLDERGVPADSYEVYIESFEEYNESVPGWESRADSLRAHWERCRTLTERHNALADSLARLLGEYGILEDPGAAEP